MEFFFTIPNNIISPMALYTFTVMPKSIKANKPQGRLSGMAVMIVSGWMKLLNCEASTM